MNGISNVVATQRCRDRATRQGRSRMPRRRWLLLSCALIGILGIGDHPRAQGPAAAFHAPGDLPGGGVASNDLSLTFSIVTNGVKSTAVVTNPATGPYTYAPNANANGNDSFTFRVTDGLAVS